MPTYRTSTLFTSRRRAFAPEAQGRHDTKKVLAGAIEAEVLAELQGLVEHATTTWRCFARRNAALLPIYRVTLGTVETRRPKS